MEQRARIVATTAVVLALASACALVFWPGLRSFPESDDFTLLAYARILRNPLALFAHEHFPLGPYFRPLAMTVWWLSAQAFGNAVAPQYALNLMLHAGVVLALWRLLIAFGCTQGLAATFAVLFGTHPIAIGTALWLSDRFDLLSTLFGLLAWRAAWLVRTTGAVAGLAIAATCALAAVMAKETGVVVCAATALLLAWPGAPRNAAQRNAAALCLFVSAAIWAAWRFSVMKDAAARVFEVGAATFTQGLPAWFADLAAYVLAWGWLAVWGKVLLAVSLACAAVLVLQWLRNGPRPHPSATPLLACAAALIAGCCVLEAPYSGFWSVPLTRASSATLIAGYARLFYLPLCALAIALSAVTRMLPSIRGWRVVAPAGAVMLGVAWAGGAHDLANAYRRASNDKRPLVTAAVSAAQAIAPGSPCRVFLLGVDARGPGYVVKTSVDAVVKALSADLARIENCLFQTEQAPWGTLAGPVPVTPAQVAPLRPMRGSRGPEEWLRVGGVQVLWLNLDAGIDARAIDGARFLQLRGPDFTDVTSEVRAGKLAVRFTCARSEQQCRHE